MIDYYKDIIKPFIRRLLPFAILLLMIFPFTVRPISAEVPEKGSDVRVTDGALKDIKDTIITLNAIRESIDSLQSDLKKREGDLEYAHTKEQKTKITNEMFDINAQIRDMSRDFERIATGVKFDSGSPEQKKRFDWQEEVQTLLGPLIRELKNLTAHPREIEKLRSEIAYYNERQSIIKTGMENIDRLIEGVDRKELKADLTLLKEDWQNRYQHISNQLTIAQYHLNEKSQGSKSFIENLQRFIRVFFLSRGLNLLFALIAFMAVWLFFSLIRRFIIREYSIRKKDGKSFYSKLFNLIFHVLTFIAATLAMLAVFYVMGDWVLFVIMLFFLFGIAWAARHTIPLYWEQGKLLLNLGPVKEHERVVYNGIPWEVSSLNFLTYLVNPLLTGGAIRLPLYELKKLISRPFAPDEPWFPCKEKDWVLLSDGTHGKVIKQTPEIVELVLLGGSRKTYPTPAFLSLMPNNISTNFRITTTFGIDYTHQTISTTKIPAMLHDVLIDGLKKEGYGSHILNLQVEFRQAASSSLDFDILADISGEAAEDYYVITRAIQRFSVDAANKYNWIIPFNQITVHTA